MGGPGRACKLAEHAHHPDIRCGQRQLHIEVRMRPVVALIHCALALRHKDTGLSKLTSQPSTNLAVALVRSARALRHKDTGYGDVGHQARM